MEPLAVMRRIFLMAFLTALAAPALAQRSALLWFDPTQLPSYCGRLERWIASPSGEVERGVMREGTQFVFPASEADALAAGIERGGSICVWGIRSRSAPVVLMLAWARTDSDPATFVERPAWFIDIKPGREPLTVSGRIQAPLLTPQGEPMGVILADGGGSIRMPTTAYRRLAAMLRPGENVVAEGLGARHGDRVAVDAVRIGRDTASLQALPEVSPPANTRR